MSVRDVSVQGQEPLPELVERHRLRLASEALLALPQPTGAATVIVIVTQTTGILLLQSRRLSAVSGC